MIFCRGNYTKINSGPKTLDFIFTDEGRAVDDAGTWRYEYYYKDHLGNTRLGFSDLNGDEEVDETEIMQQSNYYPFGLEHSGQSFIVQGSEHKYKYNGKELQDELSLNWLDYGARNYDAAVGRWLNLDPLANNYNGISPYSYALNNPISLIDPDGRSVEDPLLKNIMLLINPNSLQLKAAVSSKLAGNENWKIFNSSNIEEGANTVGDYLGDEKADNLVIRSHGSNGQL